MSNDDELAAAHHRRRRADRRDRLAAAAARGVRRADQGRLRRPRQRPRRRARPARSSAPRSCRTSSATCPGRTSTSPARPGTSAAPTSARAPRATACGCWWSWRAPTAPERAIARPAMDFDLSPDHELIRRTVRDFAAGRGGAGRRGARPHEVVPVRDRGAAREAGPDGDPVPRGVRRRRRRHARLRARGGGAHARGLLGGDHAVRAHLARDPADLPVRQRGAEARVAAAAVLGRTARRLRADRARGRLGRRQRHARARAWTTANG